MLVACWPLGLTNRILAGVDAFTYFTPYWSYRMDAFRGGHSPALEPVPLLGRAVPGEHPDRRSLPVALAAELAGAGAGAGLVRAAARLAGRGLHLHSCSRGRCRSSRLAAFAAGLVFGLGGFTLARVENINQLNALAWLPALLWLYD